MSQQTDDGLSHRIRSTGVSPHSSYYLRSSVLTSYSLWCISIITSFTHLIVQWSLAGAGTENYNKQIEFIFIPFVRNAGKRQGKEGVNEINIENEKNLKSDYTD